MRFLALAAVLVACFLLAPAADAADAAAPWRWPVEGRVITPYRNGDDPYAGGQHRGIDIAAPVGTRVVAAASGTVTFAGAAGSSGLTVAVRTDDGGFDTAYLHLASAAVRPGDHLGAGEVLGAVGTSGRRSADEPHLHFGVREAGSRFAYRDPLDFLPVLPPGSTAPRGVPVPLGAPVRARPAPVAPQAVSIHVPGGAAAPAGAPQGAARAGAPQGTARAGAPHGLGALAPAASLIATSTAGPPEAAGAARVGPSRAGSVSGPPLPAQDSSQASPSTAAGARERVRAAGRPAAHAPERPHHASSPSRRAPARHRTPVPATGPVDHGAVTAQTTARAHARPRAHGAVHHRSLDLGWLAACVAMVTAATLLGRPRAAAHSLRRALQPGVSRQ
jgi:Peptidase family M23